MPRRIPREEEARHLADECLGLNLEVQVLAYARGRRGELVLANHRHDMTSGVPTSAPIECCRLAGTIASKYTSELVVGAMPSIKPFYYSHHDGLE
jgi:hypothetical protein